MNKCLLEPAGLFFSFAGYIYSQKATLKIKYAKSSAFKEFQWGRIRKEEK